MRLLVSLILPLPLILLLTKLNVSLCSFGPETPLAIRAFCHVGEIIPRRNLTCASQSHSLRGLILPEAHGGLCQGSRCFYGAGCWLHVTFHLEDLLLRLLKGLFHYWRQILRRPSTLVDLKHHI